MLGGPLLPLVMLLLHEDLGNPHRLERRQRGQTHRKGSVGLSSTLAGASFHSQSTDLQIPFLISIGVSFL